MSATLLSPEPSVGDNPQQSGTGVEYVKSLSPEEKTMLLESLVRELIQMNEGWEVIPLESARGEWLGNLVTTKAPAAEADRHYAQLPAESRLALMKPYIEFDWNDVLTEEEMNALNQEVDRS